MNPIVLIHSKADLQSALPYLDLWLESPQDSLAVLLPGSEGKVLSELARKTIAEHFERPRESVNVSCVSPDTDALLTAIKETRGDAVLMMDHGTGSDFLAKLFGRIELPTLWLSPAHQADTRPMRQYHVRWGTNDAAPPVIDRLLGKANRFQIEPLVEERGADDRGTGDGPSMFDLVERAIMDHEIDADDLIVFGFDDPQAQEAHFRAAAKMRGSSKPCGIAILHDGPDHAEATAAWIQRTWARVAPPMGRDQRTSLAADLNDNSSPNLEFLGLISASSMLAAFGLIQDSAAVIIGAMLIAPLMTPIMGAGMAIAQGNRPLFRRAMAAILVGFAGAIAASFLFGLLYRLLHQGAVVSTSEMMNRCRPGTIDFLVGLVGGLAASYARTREHLSAALAGAAIAAALVPPIATTGLHLAFQPWIGGPVAAPVLPPLILAGINVLTIMIGSSFILWSRGIRADRKQGMHQRWSVRMIALITFLGLLMLLWTWRHTGM